MSVMVFIGLVGLLLNDADCPEIAGEIFIGQIGVRQGKITVHAPPAAPRITDDEPLLRVIVTDAENSVTANAIAEESMVSMEVA